MASNDSADSVPVGSGREACAACKYQRRKCKDDCLLAPYFPANTHDKFLKVHKLYGVHNVVNTLKLVEDPYKNDAIQSIIFESEMRHKSPVYGSAGYTIYLRQQLNKTMQELEQLLHRLAFCKYREAQGNMPVNQQFNLAHHQQHSHPSSAETPGVNQTMIVENLSQTNLMRLHALLRGNVPVNTQYNPAHHQQHSSPLSAEIPGVNQTAMIGENLSETNLHEYWLALYKLVQDPANDQQHSHPLSVGTALENKPVIRENLSNTDLSALIYPGEQDNVQGF